MAVVNEVVYYRPVAIFFVRVLVLVLVLVRKFMVSKVYQWLKNFVWKMILKVKNARCSVNVNKYSFLSVNVNNVNSGVIPDCLQVLTTCLYFISVQATMKRWKNLRTVYRRAVEAGASGSGAAVLTTYQKFILKRLHFLAPYTKGAMAVVSSLDLVR